MHDDSLTDFIYMILGKNDRNQKFEKQTEEQKAKDWIRRNLNNHKDCKHL